MDIDDYADIAQIVFYCVIASVAVLTYLKAKNTLLNSVNTEYHKHVINALIKASDTLFSEFDEKSENHWLKGYGVEDVVADVNKRFLKHKKKILESREFLGGVPVMDIQSRLSAQIREYKSDPFLPEEIRERIVNFLEGRFNVQHSTTFDELKKYMESLANGNYIDTLESNGGWVHNNVLTRLYEQGYGVSQVEEEVHQIRLDIKAYLEKFNPLNVT